MGDGASGLPDRLPLCAAGTLKPPCELSNAAQRGAMQRRMAHDTDLEPIWDEPRFIEALATLDDG